MVNIAVLGYGTVGSGVVEVINTNHDSINKRAGQDIQIKYVLDLRDFEGDPVQNILVHDYNIILEDPEVNIVVEVMGGVEPAYTFTKQALMAGKSVCTSNKELVAKHGAELLALAKKNRLNYLFEASVGGGIPIIRPLNSSLTADEITEITGILNGTTNYILTEMAEKGADFENVLKDAQEKGYAERNPEADIEGYDACRKIAILTSLVAGAQVDYEDVHTEGITKLTETDFKYAKALKASIKLLGTSQKIGDTYYSMVAPVMIGDNHPLIGVSGVFNGIFVHGNVLDDVMFYGRGAGKLPTASAVVSDVVDAVKHMHTNIMTIWEERKTKLGAFEDFENRFFVRMKDKGLDDDQMFGIKESFGDVLYVKAPEVNDELAFITEPMREGDFAERITKFEDVYSVIRVGF
ncbi:MAG: homoserine dehydrogenase [Bacteroidales bacterium]|nr:homoserine dehydrogenase [Clostridium sp.]MCM1204203.1 homoserine dehydrogenase [Bacteroidales bacterium]